MSESKFHRSRGRKHSGKSRNPTLAQSVAIGCTFVAWFLALARSGGAEGNGVLRYQVEGTACHTNFSETGAASFFVNTTFRLAVEGAKVYLRIEYAADHYCEWTFDGKDSYMLLESPNRVNPSPVMHAAATVTRDEFPTTAICWARHIWLGLGSGAYLGGSTNRSLLVPWLAGSFPQALSYKWEMDRFLDAAGLPKAINFVASEKLWKRDQEARLAKDAGGFPLKEGFIGGRFRVRETQTLGGLTLPTHFTLERYRITKEFSNDKLLEFYDVAVTNVSPTISVEFRPRIRRATDVSDMRDSTATLPFFGFIYTLTNDNWLEMSDPKRSALIEAQEPAYWKWRASLKTVRIGPWRTSRSFLTRAAYVILGCISFGTMVWLSSKLRH